MLIEEHQFGSGVQDGFVAAALPLMHLTPRAEQPMLA
jgi:hypothetical protein